MFRSPRGNPRVLRSPPMGMNLKEAWPRLGPVRWLLLAWTVTPPLATLVLAYYLKDVADFLRTNPAGLWIFTAAFAVLAGIAFLPTYAQSLLAGYVFGFAAGMPAVILGFAGGAVIGYEIARLVNGGRMMEVINRDAKWRAVRDALVGEGSARPTFWKRLGMVMLLRIPPNSPFGLTNLFMASVGVGRVPFILGTVVGMMPRTAICVMLGAGFHGTLNKDTVGDVMPFWPWKAMAIAATVIVAMIVIAIAQRAMKRVVGDSIRVGAASERSD